MGRQVGSASDEQSADRLQELAFVDRTASKLEVHGDVLGNG
jgi:hypothetical protein